MTRVAAAPNLDTAFHSLAAEYLNASRNEMTEEAVLACRVLDQYEISAHVSAQPIYPARAKVRRIADAVSNAHDYAVSRGKDRSVVGEVFLLTRSSTPMTPALGICNHEVVSISLSHEIPRMRRFWGRSPVVHEPLAQERECVTRLLLVFTSRRHVAADSDKRSQLPAQLSHDEAELHRIQPAQDRRA